MCYNYTLCLQSKPGSEATWPVIQILVKKQTGIIFTRKEPDQTRKRLCYCLRAAVTENKYFKTNRERSTVCCAIFCFAQLWRGTGLLYVWTTTLHIGYVPLQTLLDDGRVGCYPYTSLSLTSYVNIWL